MAKTWLDWPPSSGWREKAFPILYLYMRLASFTGCTVYVAVPVPAVVRMLVFHADLAIPSIDNVVIVFEGARNNDFPRRGRVGHALAGAPCSVLAGHSDLFSRVSLPR